MDISYVVTPFVAWLLAGSLKFLINSLKLKQWAWDKIGYGGLPSNHSAIVSSAAALIAFKEGYHHPAFVVAVSLAFIVLLDANSLRRQIGQHAQEINKLSENKDNILRERLGHSKLELIAGVAVGILAAWVINSIHSIESFQAIF